MASKGLIASLLVSGVVLGSCLEAAANTVPLNGSTNATFGAFTQNATGVINRADEHYVETSAGTGGSVSPPPSEWVEEGNTTGNIIFQPTEGYNLSGVTTNGVYAGKALTNNFIVSGPLRVAGSFAKRVYNFVFKDPRNNISVTNTVAHGDSIPKSFPEFIYSADGKTRSRAKSVEANGVDVSVSP